MLRVCVIGMGPIGNRHADIYRADELSELGLSAADLARLIGVPASQIVAGKRAITAETALRLGHYFGTSPELWLSLQKTYELDLARAELGKSLETLPKRAFVEA